jgi:NAD(P)-dependent dehydrogenase (short-subunit alcohol dehydrogenase family)
MMTTVKQLMALDGRTALITGAAGGLGSTMAKALAELGADLILVDRPGVDFEPLSTAIAAIRPVKIRAFDCDLELHEQRSQMLEEIHRDYATLDILVNNAAFVGTSNLEGWVVPFERQTIDTFRRAVEVNLNAAFHLSQQLAPLLRNSTGGSIINIASIYGHYGPDWRLYEGTAMENPAAYAASKGGLIQLTRWLSTNLAPKIRVNTISPGGVFRNQPEIFTKRYEARTPLQRMAKEEDFIGAVAFLASDLSSYVTGQNICVDGGWGVW